MFLLKNFQRWQATIYWFVVLIPKENNTATTNNRWVDILINILKIFLYILHLILHLINTTWFIYSIFTEAAGSRRRIATADMLRPKTSPTSFELGQERHDDDTPCIWKMQIESNWRYWNNLKYMVQHYWRLRPGDLQIWVLEKWGSYGNPHQYEGCEEEEHVDSGLG